MEVNDEIVMRARCALGRCMVSAVGVAVAVGIAPQQARGDDTSTGSLQEVVVTARHVAESILTVPQSISVFDSSALQKLGIQGFDDYATKVPNLSFQYGVANFGYAGSRSVAIRGISGAGTTGFYIDDTPVPDTIDPQVVDVQRIEVLKGPQGTLYGAGSLGGNVRIVTRQPSFAQDYEYTVSAGYTEHAATPDGRVTGIANVPVTDALAVRVVAFGDHQGGFVTREFPAESASSAVRLEHNQGATAAYGGSVSVLFKLSERVSLTARVMGQGTDGHGFSDVFAPLPGFHADGYLLQRQADIQEGWSDKWYLPSLVLSYNGSAWNVTSSTSYFNGQVYNLEDGTEGTTQLIDAFTGFEPPVGAAGVPWSINTSHNYFNHETRFAWGGKGPVRAIFGGRYAYNRDLSVIPPVYAAGLQTAGIWPNNLVWTSMLGTALRDGAIFGELYYRFSKFELTLGARKFWLREYSEVSADGLFNSGPSFQPRLSSSETGVSPKVALSYDVSKHALLYASASKGFRPGGPNVPVPSFCDPGLQQLGLTASQVANYKSDSLWNYEVGAKGEVGNLILTGAAFQMNWSGIQQHIVVPVCSFALTANGGFARVRGFELELSGRPAPGLEGRLGVGYQSPKLLEPGLTGLPAGSRILQVPYFTGTAAVTYTRPIGSGLEGFISTDFSYVGSSLSSTTVSTFGPVERAGYGLWNARVGAQWGGNELELYARNITNSEANLGDIYPISYNQVDNRGNPLPRVAVPPPLQIGLRFTRDF